MLVPLPPPFYARWSRSPPCRSRHFLLLPCSLSDSSQIHRPLARYFPLSFVVCRSLPSNLGRTDYPRSLLPAYFPDPAASRRPTPRRPSPAPQSQVNTAASARRCVYQLSCLVPPSKLPNRRQRQPAAIFLRPAAAAALLLVREVLLLQWTLAASQRYHNSD